MSQDVLPSTPLAPSSSSSGQTPLVVGLNLDGTKVAAALVDSGGTLQRPVNSCPTPAYEDPTVMLNAINGLTATVVETRTQQEPGKVAAITAVGIGTAGVVDVERGTILSATDAITGRAGTQVAAGVHERLAAQGLSELPVHVENDVDAHAAGEAWLGAGTRAEVILMVAVGTGVGDVLILDGRTRRGAHHMVGEIGHVPVPGAQSKPCTCGRAGHLKGITAGPQIHRRCLTKGGDPDVSDARRVEERTAAGDNIAAEVCRDSAACLDGTLAGLVTVIDPDVVVVSGGLVRAGDLWWEPLQQTFAAEIIDPLAPVKILPATLGTTAPIIGAARGALALASSNDNHRPQPPGLGAIRQDTPMTEQSSLQPSTQAQSATAGGHPVLERLRGGFITFAQAYPDEPMYDPRTMDQVAQACAAGGAVGVRAQGPADLVLICQHVDVPVIGLWKDGHDGVFITPILTHAIAVAAIGSQIVALDDTRRPRPDGLSLAQTVEGLRAARPEVPIMADCGSLDDARAAQDVGVDILGTTLAGYTGERPKTDELDLELVDQVAGVAEVPLVVEGRVHTPVQAAAAMEHGAFAVVVGTAIAHPTTIISWFAGALSGALWKE